ncbi:hypothetical protein Daes_2803 [Pseudodesulfovibrio aespoeensis Aspo-2]|uniref:Uncharacterized protein n=1 Tax=Pseudodesulfovibrio aespoeensis (strain ATCC 700646 / DSM 10631 / Aspo-2) TaxID=643562 RepID=E6VXI3_PSEA9|nr:hypothetical protein [Pseudodesulfovibrio sp.]ADU63799.1 hypothetical protein Daes_2803 [Pseudodesulfovibrio aespoeensis Aspo-2]MBU4515045.1 hypothetical protein [Pseudomonadota bacterium]
MFLSTSTTGTPSPQIPAPPPFSGLGHALEAVETIARDMRPQWDIRIDCEVIDMLPLPAHGYALQLCLGREIRGR